MFCPRGRYIFRGRREKNMKYYLAIDIGASSGRHIVGWREGDALHTDEVYRFPNAVRQQDGHLVWDIGALYDNVKAGIKEAFKKYPAIESLAIDTWGVDYVLLDGDKEILPCYSYRDSRTERAIQEVHKIIPFDELYAKTGTQFQPFTTIYQFYDDLKRGRLERATDFLMMPEYLSYKLTGVKAHEFTNATTTGLLNANGEYDGGIIETLGLPARLFTKIFAPKTSLGRLKKEIANEVGGDLEVVFCASHDTGSAVEGIPMAGNEPYISSGTWSLLGIKVPSLICSEESRKANYANEGGVGYIRYQKNIMGMWIVNNLKKELCPDKSFPDIVKEAQASSFTGCVDANDSRFLSPESMVKAFDGWFEGGEKPQKECDYFNCAFLSLAHSYNKAIRELESILGASYDSIYIVGGGAKNGYLNDLTEKICRKKVIALPIEATAIGNLKLQTER